MPIVAIAPSVQQQQSEKPTVSEDLFSITIGDEWSLGRHRVYCGDTKSGEFINRLPKNAALAIATPAPSWNHDYLVDEARVVAVLCCEGYIHQLCNLSQMPFRFELLIGEVYVAIFSNQSIPKPHKPIAISGVEGIVAYLINLYTQQGNFVIAPFVGHGEVLITCEKMGRICFAGERNPALVRRAIARWEKLTGKPASKTL